MCSPPERREGTEQQSLICLHSAAGLFLVQHRNSPPAKRSLIGRIGLLTKDGDVAGYRPASPLPDSWRLADLRGPISRVLAQGGR